MKYLGKNGLRVEDDGVWHEGNFNPDDIPYERILFSGARNRKYKIATYKKGASASTSGECVLYCDRLNDYGAPGTAIWQCSYYGKVFEKVEGLTNTWAKHLYIYRDTEVIDRYTTFTIYLEAPNYNDGYSIYVQKSWNVDFDVVDVTDTWFNEISGKILTSRTPTRNKAVTGLNIGGKIYMNEQVSSSDPDSTVATKKYVDDGLDSKVNNSRVLTDVPAGAKFTDTNTTYSEITTAEIDAGTANTLRTITGRRIKYILDKVQGWINSLTKSDVGLSNVDNVKQASKSEFDSHNSDSIKHITSTERSNWNAKETVSGAQSKANAAESSAKSYVDSKVLTNVPLNAKFTDTIYTHPTSAGNKHVPSGGSSGQFLKWASNGTAVWDSIPGGLELGETSGTAYRGDRGRIAYNHSQSEHAPLVHVGSVAPSDNTAHWIDTSL